MSLLHSIKTRGTAVIVALLVAALVGFTHVAAYADDAAPAASTATPAAAPAAAPADTGMAGKAAKVEVDNPYGLSALWAQGDFVDKGVLAILAIMSASSWYVMITRAISQTLQMGEGKRVNKSFWKGSAADGLKTFPKKKGPYYYLAANGLEALEEHKAVAEKVDLITWVQIQSNHGIDQVVAELQNGLWILATVGSVSPFVGLFGTVWGIYHALTAIGLAGQASIDKVAGPVGSALIMTALGLATAVPAVLGYNWLIRRNKACSDSLRSFAHDLNGLLLNNGRATSR